MYMNKKKKIDKNYMYVSPLIDSLWVESQRGQTCIQDVQNKYTRQNNLKITVKHNSLYTAI